jgi:hypothetical protein
LQLWTQVVGKVRLANTPLVNHWWNVPLYLTARGLTTSLMPDGPVALQIDFDLVAHRLDIARTDGASRSIALRAGPVADFYADVMAALAELGRPTAIWPVPVEIEGAIPLDTDRLHVTYVPEHATQFFRLLVQVQRVFVQFRSRYVGKCSPIHLFWGSLDLAVTRFSGRSAPPHPGRAPNCGPHVMREAYSHEVSSCGYWPGGSGEGMFYSYAYPEPPGFRLAGVHAPAYFDESLGEFVLPYAAVREADDPEAMLLDFLQTTYAAAAECGMWDRAALERPG